MYLAVGAYQQHPLAASLGQKEEIEGVFVERMETISFRM
jgi:hypothetical protein